MASNIEDVQKGYRVKSFFCLFAFSAGEARMTRKRRNETKVEFMETKAEKRNQHKPSSGPSNSSALPFRGRNTSDARPRTAPARSSRSGETEPESIHLHPLARTSYV